MNNLAIALMKQKRIDEAASYAETAVRHNEQMAEPMNTLGEIYLAKGDARKAAHYFKRYLVLRPEDSRGYWNTALALKEAGTTGAPSTMSRSSWRANRTLATARSHSNCWNF